MFNDRQYLITFTWHCLKLFYSLLHAAPLYILCLHLKRTNWDSCYCRGRVGYFHIISFLYIGEYKSFTFSNLFIADDLANVMKVFIQISVLLSLLYAIRFM